MNEVWNYVLIAVVALLLIAMPIMMNARNKKESQKVQEQTNSLKVGDKVLTTSGVYGTITEVKFDDSKKTVVIETGGKTKSYLTVDAYAIYTVFKRKTRKNRWKKKFWKSPKRKKIKKMLDKKSREIFVIFLFERASKTQSFSNQGGAFYEQKFGYLFFA